MPSHTGDWAACAPERDECASGPSGLFCMMRVVSVPSFLRAAFSKLPWYASSTTYRYLCVFVYVCVHVWGEKREGGGVSRCMVPPFFFLTLCRLLVSDHSTCLVSVFCAWYVLCVAFLFPRNTLPDLNFSPFTERKKKRRKPFLRHVGEKRLSNTLCRDIATTSWTASL